MSMIDKITALADGFRSLYGTTDKYSFVDMKTALSGLQIHNFFDEGQSLDTTNGDGTKDLQGLTVDDWNQYLCGKNVTFSCDIEWSGYIESASIGNRIGFEIQTTDIDNVNHWNGPWYYPQSEAGSTHLSTTQYLSEKAIKSIVYCTAYDQINSTATVKVTNFKMVVNPLGGVNKPNLFDSRLISLSNADRQGTLVTFDSKGEPIGDLNFISQLQMQLQKGASYKISFYATGSGSIITYLFGNTDAGKYVDNGRVINLSSGWKKYEQIISSDNVPIPASFNFRARGVCLGKVAELELTEV